MELVASRGEGGEYVPAGRRRGGVDAQVGEPAFDDAGADGAHERREVVVASGGDPPVGGDGPPLDLFLALFGADDASANCSNPPTSSCERSQAVVTSVARFATKSLLRRHQVRPSLTTTLAVPQRVPEGLAQAPDRGAT